MSHRIDDGKTAQQRYYHRRKAEGRCTHCGGPNFSTGTRCASCRKRRNATRRRKA